MKKTAKKIHKAVKKKVRKDFIEQGGQDGRFATKVVPNKKKKYSRSKIKKVIIDNEQ
jgi:hypothetical protein